MSTFLAYTTPAAGHAFPLVPGLLALQERGHDVHLRTAPALVAPIRRAGLPTEPVDPRIAAIRVRDHEAASGRERLRRGYADLLARGRLDGSDLDDAIADVAPDALLVDTLAYGAAIAAERSGLPWATTLPSLLPLPGRGIPPYGLGLAPRGGAAGRLRDAIGWRLVIRAYASAMLPRLNELRVEAGLAPLRSPLELFDAPDRVLALTGAPLEYGREDLPAHVRLVGAQPWDPAGAGGASLPAGGGLAAAAASSDGAAAPSWLLEPGGPWVLVTCSTEYQGDEQLAAAAIEALRDEPVRVLVTLADATDAAAASALPQAANARVERFVPHGAVLARAAAVVCHGGMGIVQKALGAGVPVAAVPFGRDQPEVARRVAECGAGGLLPRRRLSAERLRALVRDLLTPAARERAAAAGARLRAAGGPERFADAAEELVAARAPARRQPVVAKG